MEKCNVFVLYNKNSNGLLKGFGGMKKEKQVRWRDLTWIWRHLCACPLIDHGQQQMKTHTEVTLLYKMFYNSYISTIYETYRFQVEQHQPCQITDNCLIGLNHFLRNIENCLARVVHVIVIKKIEQENWCE